MNALMNVQVRILTLEARQQIKQLEAELRRFKRAVNSSGMERAAAGTDRLAGATTRYASSTNAAVAGTNRMTTSFGRAMTAGTKFGNQLQWTGRQLQYNFAMPIALGAAYATSAALKHEAAMTRIKKVYGDGTQSAEVYNAELKAMERLITALSNKFGVAREEVGAIAADWAAAGAEAGALARAVNLTMETMVLGEVDAATATKSLIAIQAQYGVNTKELTKIIGDLNMVENETGTTMNDLIQSMARSASVARTAAVDHRHLAAMTAALVPSAGSATQAGNGLKTMLTRLMSPTNQAADAMKEMGVNVYDASWNSLTAAERLEKMAESYKGLTANQKIFVSDLVAGKWQIAKWSQLMADVGSDAGYYQKALKATADPAKVTKQYMEELQAVLESNPQKFKQAGQIIRNSFADVMIKLLPYIVFVAQKMAQLAEAFGNLNPYAQMAIMGVLGFLLVFGPLLRYMGSSLTLFATMGDALRWLGRTFLGLGGAAAASAATQAAAEAAATEATAAGTGARRGIITRGAAHARSATAGAWGSIVGITRQGVAAVIAAENARATASHAGTSRWAAAQAAIQGRHASSTIGIHTAMWQALLGLQARGQGASTAGTARHAATTRGAHAATGLSLKGIWASTFGSLLGAQGRHAAASTAATASWGARMKGLQGSALASMIMAEHAFNTKRKAAWSATHGFIAGGEAGWAARMRAIQGRFLAGAIMTEHNFNVRRKGLWAATQTFIQAGHSAHMARIAGIASVGLGRHAALETAFMGTSRAKWAAYWTSMGAMGKGGAAKSAGASAAGGLVAGMKGGLKNLPKLLSRGGIWGVALLAAVGIAHHFRDEIKRAWTAISSWTGKTFASWVPFFQKLNNKIVEAFWRLPKGVRDAMLAVVRVVKAAAMAVYKLFSYLNPFARHSPSLVEQVTKGMSEIQKQYARVGNVGGVFAKAAADLKKFKDAAAALGRDEWAEQRKDVAEAFPSMIPLFNTLVGDLKELNAVARQQESAVKAQEAVVSKWEDALDGANRQLDAQQDKLDAVKDNLTSLQDAYDSHKEAMQGYADAPLKGMGAMEDKLFANEMAQKRLRLEMLKWEQANGSIEDTRNKLSLLAGDLEMARGVASDLRQAGAGSDILGPIEDEIRAMEEQYKATEQAMQKSPIKEMEKELERLGREAEILELEKSLEFDPLIRDIEKLVNAQKELSYGEIVDGINKERAAMAALTPQIDAATAAVKAQEQAVKDAQAARDAIQNTYDNEKAKLEELNEEYRLTEDLIRDIESALNDMGSASQKAISDAKEAKSAAEKDGGMDIGSKFDALGEADLPDVGGQAGIGREGDVSDIEALTEQLTKDAASMFGSLDMLAPFKKAWGKLKEWIATEAWPFIQPVFGPIGEFFSDQWGKLFDGKGIEMSGIREKVEGIGEWLYGKMIAIRDFIGAIWRLIGPDIKDALRNAWESIKTAFGDIGAEVAKYKDLWEPIKKAAGILWDFLKVLFTVAIGALLLIWKTGWSILAEVVGPIIDLISDTIENALQIIRGIIQVILAVINGDWKLAFEGMWNIVAGTLDLIWDLFKNFGAIIWGVVKGVVEGIFGFFQWLYDELVGHSVIPDMMEAIVSWFNWLMTPITTVLEWLGAIWGWVKDKWTEGWEAIKVWFGEAWAAFKAGLQVYYDWLKDTWGGVWGKVKELWTAGWDALTGFFSQRWENFKKNMTVAWDWIKDTAGTIWNKVRDGWNTSWNAITGFFSQRWENFKTNMTTAWNWIKDTAGTVWNRVRDGWNTSWSAITGFFSQRWETFKGNMNTAWNWIKDVAGGVWAAVKTKWDSAWTSLKSAVTNPIDSIKRTIDGLISKVQDLISKIANIKPPSLGSIGGGIGDMFGGFNFDFNWASGGKMPYGTAGAGFTTNTPTALVGEGGRYPEYVIPTDPRYKKNAMNLWGDLGTALGVLKRTGGTPSAIPALASGGVLGRVDARLSAASGRQSTTVSSNGGSVTEIHFHGDLSFPNVKDGNDAEDFIRNLETLVG